MAGEILAGLETRRQLVDVRELYELTKTGRMQSSHSGQR